MESDLDKIERSITCGINRFTLSDPPQTSLALSQGAEESLPIDISLPYDSKRATGFVGIVREAKGKKHLNSIVQILFHLPCLRRAVYQIPESSISASIVSSLQKIFSKLQTSQRIVSRMGLKTSTSTLQDEVKYLCEELEKSLKGTAEEGTTQKLFEGHCRKAPDDNYTRKESFSSLGLDVTNCKDEYASFDKKCNGDIESGVLFTEFPPVLQLHLSRFQNDHGKINARYEYPLELDLDKENGKYLSTDADRSIRNLYTLHSVIVHNGDGHHFALIRPRLSDLWLKYDNEVVKIVDVRRALDEQYGGDEEFPPFTFTKGSNAIMLVYVRKSEKDKIFFTMDDEEIPEHARPKKAARLKKAEEIEDNQTDSFVIIKVARVQDEQTGTGLVDFDKVLSFRIKKLSSFYKFLEIVSEHYGVPTHRIRFYKSQACPIMPKKESDTVLQMVGDSPEVRLLLQFDKSPLCATCPCPGVGVFHVFDIEDWPRKSTM